MMKRKVSLLIAAIENFLCLLDRFGCFFPTDCPAVDIQGHTTLQYATVDTLLIQLLGVAQILQHQVCGKNHRQVGTISGIYDVINLLRGIFRVPFSPQIVDDQQVKSIQFFEMQRTITKLCKSGKNGHFYAARQERKALACCGKPPVSL